MIDRDFERIDTSEARRVEEARSPEIAELLRSAASDRENGRAAGAASAELVEIARARPELLVPYASEIALLLDSAGDQVRGASLEALALVSRIAPGMFAFLVPRLHTLLASEPASYLQESALTILTNYAKTGRQAAERVIAVLSSTIDRFGTRNAVRAVKAVTRVLQHVPQLGKETIRTADRVADRLQSSLASTARAAGSRLKDVTSGLTESRAHGDANPGAKRRANRAAKPGHKAAEKLKSKRGSRKRGGG